MKNTKTIKPGDLIETQVGGPYKVISVNDGLVTFQLKDKAGIGQTILSLVTKIIKQK